MRLSGEGAGRGSSDGSKPSGGSKDDFEWEAPLKISEAQGGWDGISEILVLPGPFPLSTGRRGLGGPSLPQSLGIQSRSNIPHWELQ